MDLDKYTRLTYGGLIGALVFLGTWILKVPIVNGYLNLGDGIILISAIILGPFAAVPAAIGSALADLASGYAMYAPFTFFIKGLVALVPALLLRGRVPTFMTMLIPFILAEVIMAAGYFVADSMLLTTAGAALSLPFNLLQGFFGITLGLFGSHIVLRSKIKRF